jgi:hypothetical protein
MTNLLRIAILAALTAFAVSLFPAGQTAAAVTVIHCESSKDCPPGKRCKITHRPHHKKTGICVRASKP